MASLFDFGEPVDTTPAQAPVPPLPRLRPVAPVARAAPTAPAKRQSLTDFGEPVQAAKPAAPPVVQTPPPAVTKAPPTVTPPQITAGQGVQPGPQAPPRVNPPAPVPPAQAQQTAQPQPAQPVNPPAPVMPAPGIGAAAADALKATTPPNPFGGGNAVGPNGEGLRPGQSVVPNTELQAGMKPIADTAVRFGNAITQGITQANLDVVNGQQTDDPRAKPITGADFGDLGTLTEKFGYQFARQYPTVAGMIVGGAVGGAAAGPPGAAGGVVLGALSMTFAQQLKPAVEANIKAGQSPDAAFKNALASASQDAQWSAVSTALFGIPTLGNFFKDTVLTAVVQGGVGGAQQISQNIQGGKDPLDGVDQAVLDSVLGTAVPAAAARLLFHPPGPPADPSAVSPEVEAWLKAAQDAQAKAPSPDAAAKQAEIFRAILKQEGWSDDKINELLAKVKAGQAAAAPPPEGQPAPVATAPQAQPAGPSAALPPPGDTGAPSAAAPAPEPPPRPQTPPAAPPEAPPPAKVSLADYGEPVSTGDGTARAPVVLAHPSDLTVAEQAVHPAPTPAQIEAGNYSKAHVTIPGLGSQFPVSIETAAGGIRSGVGEDGVPWQVAMPAAYGYLRGTKAADGEQLDVFLGSDVKSPQAFIVNQNDLAGRFDELKVVLGAQSEAQARDLYLRSFSNGHGEQILGSIHPISIPDLKTFLQTPGAAEKPYVPRAPQGAPKVPQSTTDAPSSVTPPSVSPQNTAVSGPSGVTSRSEAASVGGHEGPVLGGRYEPGNYQRANDPHYVAGYEDAINDKDFNPPKGLNKGDLAGYEFGYRGGTFDRADADASRRATHPETSQLERLALTPKEAAAAGTAAQGGAAPETAVPPRKKKPAAASQSIANWHGEVEHLEPDRVKEALNDPAVKEKLNRPFTVDHAKDIKYLAGYSNDGGTIFIDKDIPTVLRVRRADGKLARIDPTPYLVWHERVEKALIDSRNYSYQGAHQIAVGAEHANLEADGFDPASYESALAKYRPQILAKSMTSLPADLDVTPYRDTGKAIPGHMEMPEGPHGPESGVASGSGESQGPAEPTGGSGAVRGGGANEGVGTEAAVAKSALPARKGRPTSALRAIISAGGIKDTGAASKGDLRSIGAYKRPGLINRNGRSLDYMREHLAQLGYFDDLYGHDNASGQSTVADLVSLIDRELRGEKVYPPGQEELVAAEGQKAAAASAQAEAEHAIDGALMDGGLKDDPALREAALAIYAREGGDPVDAIEKAAISLYNEEATPEERAQVDAIPGWEEVTADAGDVPEGGASRPEAGTPAGSEAVPRRGEDAPRPGVEATPAGAQTVLPGAERDQAGLARQRANAPLKPKAEQNLAAGGPLFTHEEDSRQGDLLAAPKRQAMAGASFAPFDGNGLVPAEHANIVNNVQSIVSRILGKNAPKIVYHDIIPADTVGEVSHSIADAAAASGRSAWPTVGGYHQHTPGLPDRSLIAVAIGDYRYLPSTIASHEAWHDVWHWLLTDGEREALGRDAARGADSTLRRYAAKEFKTTPDDPMVAKMPIEELTAYAFQRFDREATQSEAAGGLHVAFRKLFTKLRNVFQTVKRMLNRRGYKSVEDIFGSASGGEMGGRDPIIRPDGRTQREAMARPTPPPEAWGKEALRKLDDELFTLRSNTQADRIEFRKEVQAVKRDIRSSRLKYEPTPLFQHGEGDPTATLTPAQQKFWDRFIAPDKVMEDALSTKARRLARKTGLDDAETADIVRSAGYMHRMPKGKTAELDALLGGDASGGVTGGRSSRSLKQIASAMKQRVYYAAESPSGERVVISSTDKGIYRWDANRGSKIGEANPDLNIGSTVEIGGKTWTVKDGYSREIEANTRTEYYKDPVIATKMNILELKRVIRNLQFLKKLKANTEFLNNFTSGNNQAPPEGWVRVDIPGLHGWVSPKIGHVINDNLNGMQRFMEGSGVGASALDRIEAVNRLATASLFISPASHLWNVWSHWFVARGFSWANPVAYPRMVYTGLRAAKSVITHDQLYRDYLRSGASLIGSRITDHGYLDKALRDLGHDTGPSRTFWRTMGVPVRAVPAFVRGVYRASSLILWHGNDMLMMQQYLEREAPKLFGEKVAKAEGSDEFTKGTPRPEAIAKTEALIPRYRDRHTIMGNRILARFLQDPGWFQFMKYRLDQFGAYMETLRKTVLGKSATGQGGFKERWEGLGEMAALGLLWAVVIPGLGALATGLYAALTGDDKSKVTVPARGPLTPLEGAAKVADGDENILQYFNTVFSHTMLNPVNVIWQTLEQIAGQEFATVAPNKQKSPTKELVTPFPFSRKADTSWTQEAARRMAVLGGNVPVVGIGQSAGTFGVGSEAAYQGLGLQASSPKAAAPAPASAGPRITPATRPQPSRAPRAPAPAPSRPRITTSRQGDR